MIASSPPRVILAGTIAVPMTVDVDEDTVTGLVEVCAELTTNDGDTLEEGITVMLSTTGGTG